MISFVKQKIELWSQNKEPLAKLEQLTGLLMLICLINRHQNMNTLQHAE